MQPVVESKARIRFQRGLLDSIKIALRDETDKVLRLQLGIDGTSLLSNGNHYSKLIRMDHHLLRDK